MARQKYRLTAAIPSVVANLTFEATDITVYNPTQNLVLIRVGGTDIPNNAASADFWVQPYSVQTYPVHGTNFGLGLSSVLFAAPAFNAGFPANVEIVFTAGETPPGYNAMPIGNMASAGLLFVQQGNVPNGNASFTYLLAASIHTLILTGVTSQIQTVTIQGVQSGRVYYRGTYSGMTNAQYQNAFIPVDPEMDSSISIITLVSGGVGADSFILYAYQERLPPGRYDESGRVMTSAGTNNVQSVIGTGTSNDLNVKITGATINVPVTMQPPTQQSLFTLDAGGTVHGFPWGASGGQWLTDAYQSANRYPFDKGVIIHMNIISLPVACTAQIIDLNIGDARYQLAIPSAGLYRWVIQRETGGNGWTNVGSTMIGQLPYNWRLQFVNGSTVQFVVIVELLS